VADIPAFASRKTTKVIDGHNITGWFTEDFTLEELMTLSTKERIPDIRPGNTTPSKICTFQQVIDLSKAKTQEKGRVIGIYPELKHSTYFKSIGKPMEDRLITQLEQNGMNNADSPVFIQSFEPECLMEIRPKTPLKLVMLVEPTGTPVIGGCNFTTSDALMSESGLKEVAKFANVIGCYKEWIIPRDAANRMGAPSKVVKNAHDAGLEIHIWTLRPENHFLPTELKGAPVEDGNVHGDSVHEIQAYLKAGIDGFFTDAPDFGRKAIDTLQ
jgi:glycerophosphoryl diester phosphodiesterase